MEFQGFAEDDIQFAATPTQKAALESFIDATIKHNRNDITAPAGTGFEQLADILARITEQDRSLKLSRQDMIVLSNLADAWRMFAFDQTLPENYAIFPVSFQTVKQISALCDTAFASAAPGRDKANKPGHGSDFGS